MDEPSRGAQLLAEGETARREGRAEQARSSFGQAVTSYREAGDLTGEARALTHTAQIARDTGNLDWAIHDQQEAIALFRKAGAGDRLAHALRHVAEMFLEQQQLDHATGSMREALDLYRADIEAPVLDVANAMRAAALIAEALDERDAARHFWTQAQNLYVEATGAESGVSEADRRLAALG